MNTRLVAIVALLVAVQAAPAQDRERFYTEPTIPPREALDRLNLEVAWQARLPMEGRRDGLVSVQHTGRQILAQTRGGIVALYDAETGRLVWRVRIGDSFRISLAPTFSSSSIYATNGTTLYALDRSNGSPQWQLTLPGGLTAPPVADDEQVFLFTGSGTIYAYRPTLVETLEQLSPYPIPPTYGTPDFSAKKGDERVIQQVKALPSWDLLTQMRLNLPAVQSADTVLISDGSGNVRGLLKYPKDGYNPESYRFPLEVKIGAGPGVLGQVAYFPGQDGYGYAFDITRARILWRQYLGVAPLTRTPVVTDQDIYFMSDREGMSRVDRLTGEPRWRVPNGNRVVGVQAAADQFIASSPKYVYAFDKSGRMLVLDRQRGLMLSRLDLRDFVVPVVNDHTDRIYLAANNGTIVCLHDRDYPEPKEMRKISQREADAGKTPAERAKDLRDRLAKPTTFEDGEQQPLSKFLDDMRRLYGVKSFLSEKAYKDSNLPSVSDQLVKVKKRDKPAPLGDLIQDVLGQRNSKFMQIGEEIWIIPIKAGPAPK